jgi:hypothetical protein
MEKLPGKRRLRLTDYCLIMAGILFTMTGCSHGPRNEYARDLIAVIDKIYTNLEQFKKNPFAPIANEKDSSKEQSSAERVGLSINEFYALLKQMKYNAFRDIQDEDGYDAWAKATDKALRERAEKCLAILQEIKREYLKNPDGEQYKAVIRGTRYRVVWITPDDRLWFATSPAAKQGVFPESLMRANFRLHLDNIHNQDKKKE